MVPQTFIFMGRSGCGKGTQIKRLMDKIKAHAPDDDIFHLKMGDGFRAFIKSDTYAGALSKRINDEGGRQPIFLAIWIFIDALVHNLTEKEHLFIDGSPRSLEEAMMIDRALDFYGRAKPHVVYMDVSREWAVARLMERKEEADRADDTEKGIQKRMSWFEKDVEPAINFFRDRDDYHYVHIHGEQTRDEVHEEILKKLEFF